MPAKRTPEERFWEKVRRTDLCWNWMAGLHHGYGVLAVDGKNLRAHRFAYELLVGPIPDGLVIDHLCRNKRCVNPDHLEPVTQAENVRRGNWSARQGRCKNGHEYTPENTIAQGVHRKCRRCFNRRRAEWRRRRRAEGIA